MTRRTRALLTSTLGLCTFAMTNAALAEDAAVRAAMQRQVEDLRQRVDQLARQDDARATVQAVLADADGRGPLFATAPEGLYSGWDKTFFIRSADGRFSFRPGFIYQFRFVSSTTDNADETKTNAGFEFRRLKLIAAGNLVSPDLTYRVQVDANRSGGEFNLQDAWVRYKFADGWNVRVGQFKDVAFREETIGDQRQLAVERSLQNSLIGGGIIDRVQGAGVSYEVKDKFRAEITFQDGYNSDNTNFTDGTGGTAYLPGGDDYGFSGRFDVLLRGKTENYEDFTAFGVKDELLGFGAGFNFTGSGDSNVLFATADVTYKAPEHFSLFGAVTATYREVGDASGGTGAPPGESLFDWGAQVQAGYAFDNKWEVFARYTFTSLDSESVADPFDNEVHEITAGVNYYYAKHNVKLTADVTYLPTGCPSNQTGVGVLQADDAELVVRGQLQLAI